MSLLKLTFACSPSHKIAAIFDGRVRIEGVDLTCFPVSPEEAFHRAFANQDFDITELSASSAILSTARGENKYFLLPVMLSRVFRHSSFYIRNGNRLAANLARKAYRRARVSDDRRIVGTRHSF